LGLKVLLFGRLADLAGWREVTIDSPPASLNQLIDHLAAGHSDLAEALAAKTTRYALNKDMVTKDVRLPAHGELAFLPPLSGG
jgi:molybdopterin synthase sulfur carrier subunit